MDFEKAIVIANQTLEGISVIDIQAYDKDGRKYAPPSKVLLDSINATPLLDKEKIKAIVTRQYGVSKDHITFA